MWTQKRGRHVGLRILRQKKEKDRDNRMILVDGPSNTRGIVLTLPFIYFLIKCKKTLNDGLDTNLLMCLTYYTLILFSFEGKKFWRNKLFFHIIKVF